MVRIHVDPAELQRLSAEMRQAAVMLRSFSGRFSGSLRAMNWETRATIDLDRQTWAAGGSADGLADAVEAMAHYAARKAHDFAEADAAGTAALTCVDSAATSGLTRWFERLAGDLRQVGTRAAAWLSLGASLGSALAPTLAYTAGLSWVAGRLPGLAHPAAAGPDPTPTVAAPTTGGAPPQATPRYFQTNGPWAGESTIPHTPATAADPHAFARQGCLLTSIAMLIKRNRPETQVDTAFMLDLRDRVCNESGDVVWDSLGAYVHRLGLSMERPPAAANQAELLQQALANLRKQPPEPTIVGIKNGEHMHWLVVTGYQGDGTTLRPEDFTINDPYESQGSTRTRLHQFLTDPMYEGGTIEPLVTFIPSSTQS